MHTAHDDRWSDPRPATRPSATRATVARCQTCRTVQAEGPCPVCQSSRPGDVVGDLRALRGGQPGRAG